MSSQSSDFSVAVLPFLKTTAALSIGQITLRSTDDIEDLTPQQAGHVTAIKAMLFLQDNLQIRAASYAIVPFVDLSRQPADTEHLENVQAVIAYCYASPRHEFGDLFLSSERASLALLTPGPVLQTLVRPDFHVTPVVPNAQLQANKRGEIEGYSGLYNFRHFFWVAQGSRLYGPTPHVSLNEAQNLAYDIVEAADRRADYHFLLKILARPATEVSRRVFTAIRWFNAANDAAMDEAAAIVNLAIGFEALLGLPSSEKTDRLLDAISMLLGRIPRLSSWTQQFYDARSKIVHEGRAAQLRFVAADSRANRNVVGPLYQSLLSYGRQIFQVCVGTLLSGASLAEQVGIEPALETNEERFERICKILGDNTVDAGSRLDSIAPLVRVAERYRYVPETNLTARTIIGACRLAAQVLLLRDEMPGELRSQLNQFVGVQRTADHLAELEALETVESNLKNRSQWQDVPGAEAVVALMKLAWSLLFMYYYQTKAMAAERNNSKPT